MEKSCSECSKLAQSLCTLCNKWLCYQCTDVHQHQRPSTTSQYKDLHQQPRPSASECPDVHQKGPSSLPPTGQGPGPYPCSHLMCHSHRQEPLELFCESCDLLCCSSCHLSSHKNHRVVQIGKALQDQQWVLENLMVQVEDRRSAVENNAKQTEDRLHGVKIAQRKAENQIKMAKMIMMNELNKRANLLIEQLEKISEDLQQRLEDQLQGAIEMCGQLDHVQKFITWAVSHHCRNPVLFSKAMISHQMQHLFEPSPHLGSWNPVKIKFNWDASYWTKQISSLGQLTVEGGNCTYPQGLSFPSILRPQPVSCLALPSVCYRGRDPTCGYQACCERQMCCLHGIPNQHDLPVLDKQHVEPNFYNSSCVQPTRISASIPENQHLQRCCGPESSSSFQSSSQCPSISSSQSMGSLQLSCSRASSSLLQAAASQPQPKSYFYHQHQREFLLGSQAQPSAEHSILGHGQAHVQCQEKTLTSPAVDRNEMLEEEREERQRGAETNSQTAVVESRKIMDGELQQDRREQTAVQQLQEQFQVSTEAEQQGTGQTLMLKDHRDGRSQATLPGVMDQRSSSLELSVTVSQCGSDVQSSRLSPNSACARRKKRSQGIPPELADLSMSCCTERPTGCTQSLEAGPADKCDDDAGLRWRESSDGAFCMIKKPLSDTRPLTAHKIKRSSALLSYKMEPDHCPTFPNEDIQCEVQETCKKLENTHSSQEAQMSLAKSRVPVVCLERLKILVSQLPPHGRRQSDPLPTSGTENSETAPQQKTWQDTTNQEKAGCSETIRTAHLHTSPPYVERQSCDPSFTAHLAKTDFDCRRLCATAEVTVPSTDSTDVPPSTSALDQDLESDHRTISNVTAISQGDLDSGQRSDLCPSTESDPHADSSSEAESECLTQDKSADIRKTGLCEEPAVVDPEASLSYEADPKLDDGADLLYAQQLDGEAESSNLETESDLQPEYDDILQTEIDSDIVSDPPPDSQYSVESEPDRESESEGITDEPQPLQSDQEEEADIEHGHRPILIANPVLPQRACEMEEVQPDQDQADMDSEDFCAVCLIGGDLLCCDRCPKVFHLSCHVPSLLSFPSGDWICSLCRNVVQPEVEYDCDNKTASVGQDSACGLSACDQRKCEKLTLLILSNVLSAPFHEPVSPLARHYYQIIKKPMDLSVIRVKLKKRCSQHYHSPEQFVADVYLMFRNCAKFNYPDSEVAQAGRSLWDFFTSKLKRVFPDRVFPTAEPDSDSDEYDEADGTSDGGFPWPERREQCHRKRKRRNSLKSRRHYF